MEFNKIKFIGSRLNAIGMKLVGLQEIDILDGRPVIDRLINHITKKDYDLIIIEDDSLKYATAQEINIIGTSVKPLILIIPLGKENEPLAELAKKILGIDIGDLK